MALKHLVHFLALRRSFLVGLWLMICCNQLMAQPSGWAAMDRGLSGWPTAACFWNDTLYATSLPSEYEGLLCRWTGSRWDTVARMRTAQHMLINRLVVFRNELILVGYFEHINNLPDTKSIVAWDGKRFRGLGLGLKHSLLPNITDAVVHADRLFICGPFSTVGDLPAAPRLASWDGERWQPAFQRVVGLFDRFAYGGGQLLAMGQVDTLDGSPSGNLVRFNGSAWQSVDHHSDPIRSLRLDCCTFWHEEPVCQGRFQTESGIPRSAWGRWSGTGWHLLPADSDSLPLVAYGVVNLDDSLMVAYGYDSWGRDPADDQNAMMLHMYLTKGAGYSLASRLDGSINWMVALGDTFYAGGAFKGAYTDGMYIRIPGRVAHWIRPRAVGRKGHLQTKVRLAYRPEGVVLVNETSRSLHVECVDVLGRSMGRWDFPVEVMETKLPTNDWPYGLYILRITHPDGQMVVKWLKI